MDCHRGRRSRHWPVRFHHGDDHGAFSVHPCCALLCVCGDRLVVGLWVDNPFSIPPHTRPDFAIPVTVHTPVATALREFVVASVGGDDFETVLRMVARSRLDVALPDGMAVQANVSWIEFESLD